MAKNYYEILGVDKTADDETIKKAYRKLVRKYHPDVSKEPDAAERTTEINLAYETLSHPEKRAQYDAELAQPRGNPFQGAAGGNPFGGNHFDGNHFGEQGFRYEYTGGAPFGADDFQFEDLFSAFAQQQAHARRSQGKQRGEDQHAELAIDIYASYAGAERTLTLNVPTLDAAGHQTVQQKTLNVKIPKGIAEGQQIRLAGQGLAGYNGGENGDLYLKIRFHARPHLYVKNRKDVYQTINVMPWQAVLGGKIIIATASGRLHVTLPANSQNGKTIRLKGQGIPAKEAGDLYLIIHIVVPEANSEAERALWQQLADHYAQSAH